MTTPKPVLNLRANKAKIQRALKRWRMSSEGKRKMKALAKLRAKLRRESIEGDIRGMFAQTSAVQNKWKALISQAVDHLGKASSGKAVTTLIVKVVQDV